MQKIPFVIESIDPLGQGVSRLNGKVVFIAKTLPGESGCAISCKKAKGVEFARLQKLEVASPLRQEPSCPHYASCPGCQFLHTGYATELANKLDTLARCLGRLGVEKEMIGVIPAGQRLAYRNRIQLHYRNGRIGLVDGLQDLIVEIPDCQVVQEELRASLSALYAGEEWKRGARQAGPLRTLPAWR
jgi:23S rRNA (uracil1939-C5)-methyltransferase